MTTVFVSALKSGERISEEVRTPLGGLLMEKGRTLSPRDLEILRAFMVKSVVIEGKDDDNKEENQSDAGESPSDDYLQFYKEYDELYKLMKRGFRIVTAGTDSLPLMEIRTQLDRMLKLAHVYNPLTFSPRRSNNVEDYIIHNGMMAGLTAWSIARWLGYQQKDWIPLALAGMLHDIGNLRVDETILQKRKPLTAAEYEEVKQHTVIGYNILKNIAGLNEGVKLSALQHHERLDGSGYPLGLRDEKIHPYARIVAIADIFHTMTSDRSYKKAVSPYLALEEMLQESFGKLDPAVVRMFIGKVTQFHHGTVVRLNDGSVAEIVFTDQNHPTRPMVNVNGKIINLAVERNRFIQNVIS